MKGFFLLNNTIYKEILYREIQGKSLPYYEDENDYGRIPIYKVSELNEEELKIYNEDCAKSIYSNIYKLESIKIENKVIFFNGSHLCCCFWEKVL